MADRSSDEEESLAGNLSKDVMLLILLTLPVKTLLRYKAVCKSWYYFLKSPNFIKLHLAHQKSRPVSTLIAYNRENDGYPHLALLHLPHPSDNQNLDKDALLKKLDLPFAIEDKHDAGLEFSCNGLLCFINHRYKPTPEVILWNPATRKHKSIRFPFERPVYTYLRLGYIEESNDWKLLIAPLDIDYGRTKMAWVYTLSSDSWKTVPFTLFKSIVQYGSQVSVNGFLYWPVISAVHCIISFDLVKDEFKAIDVPDDRGFHRTDIHRSVMVWRGSLAMMVYISGGSWNPEIWVMKTYRDQFSWTKEFILEPNVIPRGIWYADKLLFVYQGSVLKESYSYDLVTKRIDLIHMPKEEELAPYTGLRGCYFESLVGTLR